MTILRKLGEKGLTIWTVVAIAIGLISLGVGVQASHTLYNVNATLEDTDAKAEWGFAVARLTSVGWQVSISEAQGRALSSPQPYVALSSPGQYVLTEKGEKALPLKFKKVSEELVRKDKEMAVNEVILNLNLRELFATALKKDIEPEVMLGMTATYIEELKRKSP